MKIRVIGYNDLKLKPHGPAKRLRPEHWFESDRVPSNEYMKEYCEARGYPILNGMQVIPGVGIFGSDGRCEPVYEYIDDPVLAGRDNPPIPSPARKMRQSNISI